ncbi:hypothetical protein U0021_09900 (plasmid) [Moraxella canis]|uniref:Uncharacterized protein n=1 Tax=Moraxella canis TaxID=90239 RepID=A0ABZ0X142_9GAMM|nr:hypothetical protein [Moraxella canis]WQE05017.1 hypothetical protein U0021_09900 [Moraxella canis]
MKIEAKIKLAEELKNKLENIKKMKAELKLLTDEIIKQKKFELNSKIIEEISKNKSDQNKIDRLIKMSDNFSNTIYKDYEKCISDFDKIIQEMEEMNKSPIHNNNAYNFHNH